VTNGADYQSAKQQVTNLRYLDMPAPEPNPGLERVRYELRASGIPLDPANPLRSGTHSRGYLPHVKREGASYFVTFRLDDSLPREVLAQYRREKQQALLKAADQDREALKEIELEYRRKIERYLDRGVGACYLRRAEVADMVAGSLTYFHEKQYLLDEWVIMPNHVHLILWPMPNHTLSEILRSRKRRTAREANTILGRTGQSFWQPVSFDHWIRNDEEKARIQRYIRNNPVKAKLCRAPEEWRWGSAHAAAARRLPPCGRAG